MDNVTPIVGLEKLYVAKILQDDNTGTKFDVPKYFPGVKEIGMKPKVNSDPFFAENKLWQSEDTLESIDVEIDITDIVPEEESFLLGHTLAEEGGVIYSENDKAPEVALLFKSNKGNGKGRYIVLYRGTFAISDESYKGKEGKTNYQTKKLKATFAPLKNNGRWKYKVDEEQGMNDEKFFKEVLMPSKKS